MSESRARVGRPPVGPAIQVRLAPEQLAWVDRYARAAGCSRAEAIRRLLTETFDRHRNGLPAPESSPPLAGDEHDQPVEVEAELLDGEPEPSPMARPQVDLFRR
jgi:hypothetical protein